MDKTFMLASAGQKIFHVSDFENKVFIVQTDVQAQLCHLIFNVGVEGKLSLILINSAAQDQKIDVEINLNGKNAQADIKGLYILRSEQKLYVRTAQNHQAQNTQSNLTFNGIISDSAIAYYDGMIEIIQDASNSVAKQQNKNILLSNKAKAESKPNLQVHTNQVQCAHGSAVGQLDALQLFYLQSRGIETQKAKKVLLQGFLSNIVDEFPLDVITNIHNQLDQLCQNI